MDSFVTYAQPSFELFAKLSAVVPLWLLMVMADKRLMGIPLLEGSIWRSPRIPPRITMRPSHGEVKPSRFEADRHPATGSPNSSRGGEEAPLFESVWPSEPSSSGPFEPGFSDIMTQIRQPNQGSLFTSNSPSLGASTTTALSTYMPLEMHDPLFVWTAWYESNYFCTAIMLLVAMLFLGIINICRSLCTSQETQASTHRNTKDVGTQYPEFAHQQLLAITEYPIFWEFVPTCGEMNAKQQETKSHEEPEMQKDIEFTEGVDKMQKDTGEGERTEAVTADVTVTWGEAESYEEGGDQLRSEAGEGEDKEESEKRSDVDEEDGGKETANNAGDDGLDGSQVVGGEMKKKKKRRVRGSAKQRAAKRAGAAESSSTTGEASNDLLQDQKQRGHEEGKPKLLGSEVAELGSSDVLAVSKAKDKDKDKAPVEDFEAASKEGSYSLKQTDLHEATFVATDATKKPSLPPRPPTPQSKEKCAPLGLPPRPQFTKLPITKNNGNPQSATATTAKPSISSSLWASTGKEPAQPKRDVPPLLPHHQSFGVAQRKPFFGNLPSQGGPIAGTNPGPSSYFGGNIGVNGSSFFGGPPPNGPMYHFGGDRGGAGR